MSGSLLADADLVEVADPFVLDAAFAPDEAAAWAARAEFDAGVLTPFGVIDPNRLSRAGRLDLLSALERARAWVDAQQQVVLAMVGQEAERGPDWERRWVRDEVAAVLRLAPVTAESRLAEADTLATRFPDTLEALEAGRITMMHARVLLDETAMLSNATIDDYDPDRIREMQHAVEARVLGRAPEQTVGEFRRAVRRAAAAADVRRSEQQHSAAVADRHVRVAPAEYGMAYLSAFLPADDAAAVWTALEALAAMAQPDDDRTADQRRADALTGLADRLLTGAPALGGTWQGRRPSVQVSVALSTLLGLDEQPAELDGHGPIPAELARRIAADPTGTWTRLVTDPAGRLLEYGQTTYRPPAELREHLLARDRRCRFPGCGRAARRSEIDHVVAFSAGGPTAAGNLQVLCRRHHLLKHDTDWAVIRNEDGATVWTSPTGKTFTKPPDTLPVDRTVIADLPPPF